MKSRPGDLALRTPLAAAMLALAVTSAGATTWYKVRDLGALPGDTSSIATGLNNHGDVVGWSNGPNGYSGFVWTKSAGMTPLAGLADRPRAFPRDINDVGDIVGTADRGGVDLGHAVRWRGGVPQDLGALNGPYSAGWGINNAGDVAGQSDTQVNGINVFHAFVYTDATGMVDLTPGAGDSVAHGINDAGQATGYRTVGGVYHAFRWRNGSFIDLGVLPGFAHSFGFAIEPGGSVAGSSKSASGNSERVARYVDGSGLQDLGGSGEHNQAWGINAALTVVGQLGESAARAFVYTDAEGLRDMNGLIDRSQGWRLQTAFDIDEDGVVVGRAYNNFDNQTHAVLLAPTTKEPPECSTRCLRSNKISLIGKVVGNKAQVDGKVVVKDEHGTAVPDATVNITWTLPDGSTQDRFDSTNAQGSAKFSATGPLGTWRLDVNGISKSLYTFNPKKSVLRKSVAVP